MKRISIVLIILAVVFTSCQQGMRSAKVIEQENDTGGAEVIEVINGSTYTYLKVDQGGEEMWLATDLFGFETGDVIYFEGGLEMKDFESKELQRTFESIYFVDNISGEPAGMEDPHAGMVMGDEPQKPVIEKVDIEVEKAEDGYSIAEIYSTRKDLAGKTVKVRGQVTKVNSNIMGRNWVHIQDGTADGGNYDLTITTDDNPEIGEVLTYTGALNLDVDFGYGYFYEVILEDAVALEHR